MSSVHRYFRVDASTAQFHIERQENATGVWSVWYRSHLDHSIVLKDVFVSKEAKHILKVHTVPFLQLLVQFKLCLISCYETNTYNT